MGTKSMVLTVALTLNLFGLAHADAPRAPTWLSDGGTCPLLMTADECAQLRVTYAALTAGPERDELLRQHDETMRDRESACGCLRAEVAAPIYQLPPLHATSKRSAERLLDPGT